jgi:hypothetical protein
MTEVKKLRPSGLIDSTFLPDRVRERWGETLDSHVQALEPIMGEHATATKDIQASNRLSARGKHEALKALTEKSEAQINHVTEKRLTGMNDLRGRIEIPPYSALVGKIPTENHAEIRQRLMQLDPLLRLARVKQFAEAGDIHVVHAATSDPLKEVVPEHEIAGLRETVVHAKFPEIFQLFDDLNNALAQIKSNGNVALKSVGKRDHEIRFPN